MLSQTKTCRSFAILLTVCITSHGCKPQPIPDVQIERTHLTDLGEKKFQNWKKPRRFISKSELKSFIKNGFEGVHHSKFEPGFDFVDIYQGWSPLYYDVAISVLDDPSSSEMDHFNAVMCLSFAFQENAINRLLLELENDDFARARNASYVIYTPIHTLRYKYLDIKLLDAIVKNPDTDFAVKRTVVRILKSVREYDRREGKGDPPKRNAYQ